MGRDRMQSENESCSEDGNSIKEEKRKEGGRGEQ